MNIFFRADGNNEMGLGHIIRSSALADMIRDEYDCSLVTNCSIQQVVEGATAFFKNIIQLPPMDLALEATLVSEIFHEADLVILDGYSFDSGYQLQLLKNKFDFFSIDDIHATEFFSKVIINHSGGIGTTQYRTRRPGSLFYLGPSYSLLRKPFLDAAGTRGPRTANKNCFVCFGGADPGNKTLEIMSDPGVSEYFAQLHVVVGSAYREFDELQRLAAATGSIFIYHDLDENEMVEVMKKCSFAICSPSSIVYEYMSVGGIVFLEQIAKNQEDVFRFMTGEGLAFSFEEFTGANDPRWPASLEKQADIFDGKSSERFKKIFHQYFYGQSITIRRANDGDLLICYRWANDSLVRQQSYHQEAISLPQHAQWFREKLSDPQVFFYILEMDGKPIGQIRFQVGNGEAVLGYLADQGTRNKGLGAIMLSKGLDQFTDDYRKEIAIIGHVKKSNISSQRSFEKLRFFKTTSQKYPDSFTYTFHYDN